MAGARVGLVSFTNALVKLHEGIYAGLRSPGVTMAEWQAADHEYSKLLSDRVASLKSSEFDGINELAVRFPESMGLYGEMTPFEAAWIVGNDVLLTKMIDACDSPVDLYQGDERKLQYLVREHTKPTSRPARISCEPLTRLIARLQTMKEAPAIDWRELLRCVYAMSPSSDYYQTSEEDLRAYFANPAVSKLLTTLMASCQGLEFDALQREICHSTPALLDQLRKLHFEANAGSAHLFFGATLATEKPPVLAP